MLYFIIFFCLLSAFFDAPPKRDSNRKPLIITQQRHNLYNALAPAPPPGPLPTGIKWGNLLVKLPIMVQHFALNVYVHLQCYKGSKMKKKIKTIT